MTEHTPQLPLFTTSTVNPALEIPYGYCKCGCGQKTNLADRTRPKRGLIKGEPYHFVDGHCNRGPISYTVDEDTGCWLWNGALSKKGYGHIKRNRKSIPAHRYFWEQRNGPIPDPKMDVHHKCLNKRCVNPDHLEALTRKDHAHVGPVTKLSQADVDEIRRLRGQVRQTVLATRYGVNFHTISNIQLGKQR